MPGKWDGKSRITTKAYKDNYDRIFGKKVEKRKRKGKNEKNSNDNRNTFNNSCTSRVFYT